MTTIAPAGTLEEAGSELLDELRRLVERGTADVPGLLDGLTAALKRARRKVNAAMKKQPEPEPAPTKQPSSSASAPRVQPEPKVVDPAPKPSVTEPTPKSSDTPATTPRSTTPVVTPRNVPSRRDDLPRRDVSPRRSPVSKRARWLTLVAVVLLVAAGAVAWWLLSSSGEPERTAKEEAAIAKCREEAKGYPTMQDLKEFRVRTITHEDNRYELFGEATAGNHYGGTHTLTFQCRVRDQGKWWELIDLTMI